MSVDQIQDRMIHYNYECVKCCNKWNTCYRKPDDFYEKVWAGYTAANADACPKCNKINPPEGHGIQ